jgi:FtsZ-binding cell division protein ZapB
MFHAATWNLYFTIGAGFMISFIDDKPEYITRFPLGLTMPLDNYPVLFTVYGAPAIVLNEPVHTEVQWGIAVTYSFSRGEDLYEKRQHAVKQSRILKGEVTDLKSGLDETRGQLSKTERDLEQTREKLSDTENELNTIKK